MVNGGEDMFIGWEWKPMDDGLGFTVNTIFQSHKEFDRYNQMIRDNSSSYASQLNQTMDNCYRVDDYIIATNNELARSSSNSRITPGHHYNAVPSLEAYGEPVYGFYAGERTDFVRYYGFVPVLDIAAGLYNYDTWDDISDEWTLTYSVEVVSGAILFCSWGLVQVMPSMMTIFDMNTKLHILVETAVLYLVYAADDAFENTENSGTEFSYMAAAVGLFLSVGMQVV